MEEQFATLRELLTESPSEGLWQQIKGCLNTWPTDTVNSVAVDYLRSHFVSWPEEYQDALERWAPLRWNTKTKRRVQARRGSPHNPKSLKRPKPVSVKEYRDIWRNELTYPFTSHRNYYSEELGEEGMAFLALVEEAWAEDAPETMDVDIEAMTLAIALHHDVKFTSKRNLIDFLFRVQGIQFVFDVLRRLRRAPMTYRYSYYENQEKLEGLYDKKELDSYVFLRRLLATLSDAEYEEIRTHLDSCFDDADAFTQCMLAFCFPEQTSWGDKALQSYIRLREEDQPLSGHGFILAAFASGGSLALKQKIMEEHSFNPHQYYELLFSMLDVIGSDAFSLLKSMYQGSWWRYDGRIAEAVATIESEEVAQLFADGLDRWRDGAPDVETTYLKLFPHWARPALEVSIAKAKKENRESKRAEALLSVLAADVELIVKEVKQDGQFVDRSSLPRGLASPPWHDAPTDKPKQKKKKASKLETLPYEPRFFMTEEERREFVEEREAHDQEQGNDAEKDATLFAEIESAFEEDRYFWLNLREISLAGCSRLLSILPPEQLWDKANFYYYVQAILLPWLEREGPTGDEAEERAFAGFWEQVRGWDKKTLVPMLPNLDDPALAPLVAEIAMSKTSRSEAVAWLGRFPKAAAIGLIPAIVNTKGKKKKATYESALLHAIEKGDRETVEEVARAYGDEVVEQLAALDPYQLYPSKMPKMPFFWSPSSYTPLRLASHPELQLPMEVIEDIGLMLKFSFANPYIGLRELQEVVDPIALDRWVWELFTSWVNGDCPMDEIWPLHALAFFGQGAMLEELPLLVDQWYSTGHHQRGWRLMEAFKEASTPWSVLALELLRTATFHPYVSGDVWSRISKLPGAKSDEGNRFIVDQRLPTLGWENDGGPTVERDDGSALFVSLDPALTPMLQDAQGMLLYDLPEEDSGAGRVVWDALQQQLAWVAPLILLRWETDMRSGSRWSLQEWDEAICVHPLLHHVAKGLVWAFYKDEDDGELLSIFRIDAEKQRLIDIRGKEVKRPEGAVIGLPHPMTLDDKDAKAWRKALKKAGIEQPFPQLDRPIFAPTKEETSESKLLRFHGKMMAEDGLSLLARTGWSGDKREHIMHCISCEMPVSPSRGSASVMLSFGTGVLMTEYLRRAQVEIKQVSLRRSDFASQPAMWVSELIYDLTRLSGE